MKYDLCVHRQEGAGEHGTEGRAFTELPFLESDLGTGYALKG